MNGYILESKSILDSAIWQKPPLYFKVWHYLLLNAQYADYGNLKRGQLYTSISELQDACTYFIGYRKERPTRRQIFDVLEWLRNPCERNTNVTTNEAMIVTAKVTHGILVTICNYNVYQDPKHYESNSERNDESTTKHSRTYKKRNNIIKEYKEIKNNYSYSLPDDHSENFEDRLRAWRMERGLSPDRKEI